MHHTRSECPRSPGTHLFGQVKLRFISRNHSSRRSKFQLSLKIIWFRVKICILSAVNCFKVGSEHRLALVAQWLTGKWYWTTNLAHLRGTNALSRIARERAGKKVDRHQMRPDRAVNIHPEWGRPVKRSGFCSLWSSWISTTVSFLPLPRTCSFRGPLLLDILAAKPPVPQGFRPWTV